jgi:elongation factor G
MAGTHDGVRAVALTGPGGAGKTSLFETLLSVAGALPRPGSVAAGTSLGDSSPEARARHQSTELTVAEAQYLGDRFALIDTPGSVHFAHDSSRLLPAVDLALVVVEPDPDRAQFAQPTLRALAAAGTPHAIFVNKIEDARGRIRDLLAALQPMAAAPLVARQIPIREGERVTGFVDLALERAYAYRRAAPSERVAMPSELAEREHEARFHMLEQLSEHDDALLEALVSDLEPPPAQVFADLTAELAANQIVPVFFGSALNGFGIRRLWKALRHETPEPAAAAARVNAAAHMFKLSNAAAVGRLALTRLFADPPAGATVFALKGTEVAKAEPQRGMIAGLAKWEPPTLPAPLQGPVVLAVHPADRKDDVRVAGALAKLVEEDCGLTLDRDSGGAILLRGQSGEHLRLVLDRLSRRYGVQVTTSAAPVGYREGIRRPAAQRSRHKKQSGGHGQFADVAIEIEPLSQGQGFRFESAVTGGAVPRQYLPAVEAGCRDACEEGPLGFPVVDVRVRLIDGLAHSVDSSDLAFRIAGRMAMADALRAAQPYLLEPVATVTIRTPAQATARLTGAVAARRGQILGFEPLAGWHGWDVIEAYLPEAEVVALAAEARAAAQGLATLSWRHDHLAELNGRAAIDLMARRAA